MQRENAYNPYIDIAIVFSYIVISITYYYDYILLRRLLLLYYY